MLPGHVERRRVKCGKPNCKCARGVYHVAHYHVWHSGGVRFRQFVRAAEVAGVRAACDEYRDLQAQLRSGRASYRAMISRFRESLRTLDGARKAGWL